MYGTTRGPPQKVHHSGPKLSRVESCPTTTKVRGLTEDISGKKYSPDAPNGAIRTGVWVVVVRPVVGTTGGLKTKPTTECVFSKKFEVQKTGLEVMGGAIC